jgi:hypothetical protein
MKKSFSLSFFLLFSLMGYSQSPNLTGEWVGVMSVDVNRTQQNVFVNFSLQIKQSGQAIWGIYTGGNKLSTDSCDCAGRLTSRVSREQGRSGYLLPGRHRTSYHSGRLLYVFQHAQSEL